MKRKFIYTVVFLILIIYSGCTNKNVVPADDPNSPEMVSETTVTKEEISPQEIEKPTTSIAEQMTDKVVDIDYERKETAASKSEIAQPETLQEVHNSVANCPENNSQSDILTHEKEVAETPITEVQQKENPTVDIDFYISYAKSFAESIGLKYDSTARDCWDNPITATANKDRFIADIESRLNRYKNIEGFEYVCIWYEKITENEYDIYIGYA